MSFKGVGIVGVPIVTPTYGTTELNADPRRKGLAYDPDTKSFKPNEARAGLQAEADGVLDPPVSRDIDESGRSGGGDLLDGNGRPWDIKDASAGSDQIVDIASPKGGKGGEDILVDTSRLSAAEQKALEADIGRKLPPDAKDVRFVPKR